MAMNTPPTRAGIFLHISPQEAFSVPAPAAPRKESKRFSSLSQDRSSTCRRLFHGHEDEDIISEEEQWERPPEIKKDTVAPQKAIMQSKAHGDMMGELSENLLQLQNPCKAIRDS